MQFSLNSRFLQSTLAIREKLFCVLLLSNIFIHTEFKYFNPIAVHPKVFLFFCKGYEWWNKIDLEEMLQFANCQASAFSFSLSNSHMRKISFCSSFFSLF